MKKLIFLVSIIFICGCTNGHSFEPMRTIGLIPAWESGYENYFYISDIVTGGSGYYACVLAPNAQLPNGVSIGGYDGCEVSGVVTLNPGTTKLITPPFLVTVSDDSGNYANVSVSLTVVSNAPRVTGNYFECVVGQSCNEKLAEASDGSEPYTYRLGSMAYGTMPPGTSVSVDGYITGTPSHAGEYSFQICVTDSQNIAACSYGGINVVSDESELGQNEYYISYEDQLENIPKLRFEIIKAGSSSDSILSLIYPPNFANCTETNCIWEIPNNSYVNIKGFFGPSTYFAEWQGIECDSGFSDNYYNNETTCSFYLTENTTITAFFNKRPALNVNTVSCVFSRSNPDYDSKFYDYYTITVAGTASTGTVGSELNVGISHSVNVDEGSSSLDCGAWTKEINEDDIAVCVRKAAEPDSTAFSLTVYDFCPWGYLHPYTAYASVDENLEDVYIYIGSFGKEGPCWDEII
jgi:hypothetical protein